MPESGLCIKNTYILHEKLGQGGMGTVYRATHRLSGQVVALKRVTPPGALGEGAARRSTRQRLQELDLRVALAQEFRLLASLHHPNIVRVIDYGFDEEQRPFFTMELLESPQTIVEAGRTLSVGQKMGLITQLLQALSYLHRCRILHCDIKPTSVTIEGA